MHIGRRTVPARRPIARWLALGAVALTPAACGPKGGGTAPGRGPAAATGTATSAAASPFAPASVRIHPLTQLDTSVGGQCRVVLHLELRDRFGDPVKGLGVLRVQLYKPGAATGLATGAAGLETQELNWDVPQMADPEQNSQRYDAVTRTYRIPLNAPAWVCEPKRQGDGAAWWKLRAVLTIGTTDGGGTAFIEDEFVIQR